jgi:hypothetical protein
MKSKYRNKRVVGYKKLTDSELGRKDNHTVHVGLDRSFLDLFKDADKSELVLSECVFKYENSIINSNCLIKESPKKSGSSTVVLQSGEIEDDTIIKQIHKICSKNKKEYYLVWDVSSTEGKFLLVENESDDYIFIGKLENGKFDEAKVELIQRYFNSSQESVVEFEHEKMTTFSLEVMKLLIKEFGEDFLKENLEEDKSVLTDVKLKIPKYMGTPIVFGVFNSESSFNSKSKKKFHPENLKILGYDFIYFTNQFTEVFSSTSNHCAMDRFANLVHDYSEKKYSVQKKGKVFQLVNYINRPASYKPIQKIFFGPPGTGKSHHIREEYGKDLPRITFHPELDYQGFIGSYKPTVVAAPGGDQITYKFVEEAFLRAYCKAWASDEPNYIVIEEINRGNCAQIFGDIFQLLDRNERGFSEYPIICSPDVQRHLESQLAGISRLQEYKRETNSEDFSRMTLPNNLNILCTMNTSDQSLFPMDSAFKRRWDWQYVPINYQDANRFKIDLGDGKEFNWGAFIKEVNKKIKDHTQSEDKQLGNRFVSPAFGSSITKEEFVSKVVFYLWSEIYKDEQGSGESIFYVDNENEITFSDFFKDGDVNTTTTRKFVDYILSKSNMEENSTDGDSSDNESENENQQ